MSFARRGNSQTKGNLGALRESARDRADLESNGDEDGVDPSSKTLYAGNGSGMSHHQDEQTQSNSSKSKAAARFAKEVMMLATTRIGAPASNFASPREGMFGGAKKAKQIPISATPAPKNINFSNLPPLK